MKKTTLKLSIAAVATAAIFAAYPAMASFAKKHIKTATVLQTSHANLTVKILENDDESVIVQTDILQDKDQKGVLRINDGVGNFLYDEAVSGKTITRKFKISFADVAKLQFVFTNDDGQLRKTFAINITDVKSINIAEVSK